MDDPAVAQLRRWETSGGRWRVLTRTADTAVVALLTCDTGEEVDRLTGTGPALLTYLGERTTSEDEAAAVVRDRDPTGRPRNSRPRDALGRPLAPGAPGVPTMPDDLDVPPADALQLAQQLLDDGFPFHAHEVLEAAWKAAPDTERELWRGLAQLAVGLTHDRRGNTTGAARLLTRAADRIGTFAGAAPHGIAAAELSGWARAAAADITAGRAAPEGRIPRLTS
jgi:predicted metal-dependent hydrolase